MIKQINIQITQIIYIYKCTLLQQKKQRLLFDSSKFVTRVLNNYTIV